MTTLVAHEGLLALDQTLQAVEALWAPRHPDWASEQFYGREPLPASNFLAGIGVLGAAQGRTFLDVGCGVGTKMHLVRMLGWDYISGLDRYEPYVSAAHDLCPWAKIWTDEATTCDRYSEFDVVYMYRLCVSEEDEIALEKLIVSRMKPGALAFFGQAVTRDLGEPLGHDVWRIG